MRSLILQIFCIAVSQNAFAKDIKRPRKPAQSSTISISVTPMDEDFDASGLKREGIKIQEQNEVPEEERIPTPRERNLIFNKAGILKSVQAWDDLEKDILFMRAKNYSLEDLKKKYPKISPQYLSNLQRALGKK